MTISLSDLKTDCRHFRGDLPCRPHKEHGVHCTDPRGNTCVHYDPTDRRILIVKLGAIGDVIRTTPLLRKFKEISPHAEIWWLTHSPEVLPREWIDVVLPYSPTSLATLQATGFDTVYCLDKDREACALSLLLSARMKKGFTLQNGKCVPVDADAHHKYLTGVFDDVSKANTKSYQQEIFELCGFTFRREENIMPRLPEFSWKISRKKPVVGLNTGCGGRWTSRLWPDAYWVSLARKLKKAGCTPLLLGGEQEHLKNRKLAKASGAAYLGHFPLQKFMGEVDQCDLVVTAVTMAMHIAIGLKKKIVLFNNIFNKYEFELYGRGEVLEPDFDCNCFYSPTCPNNCMQYLAADTVFSSCMRLLDA